MRLLKGQKMVSKALGRGFESLIPTELIDDEFDPTVEEDEKNSLLKELSLGEIFRDENQPRKEFSEEALETLADSIKQFGVLQPIVVTKENDGYKIVAGERRFRAAKIAGLSTIPAIIRTIDVQNRLELSIIENAQREDLNVIELATAFAKLKTQFNLSTQEIGEKVGRSESSVENIMRLLRFSDEVKHVMVKEKLSEGVMRPLLALKEEEIQTILPRIVSEGWTARRVESYVAENKKKSSTIAVQKRIYEKDEERLNKKFNARTKIHGRSITITCDSKEKLKELIEKLG